MPTILIVEDNEMIREMLAERLEMRGFTVITAENGEQGVQRAGAAQPDLIIMDMNLPILDGWEATRRLKGAAPTLQIPIIGLTAYSVGGDRERCLAAGCDEYATKPVDFPELLAKMQQLITPEAGE